MVDFRQLDRTIHERGRLAIMTLLASRRHWCFADLRDELSMSDGNLITHLRALQKAGFVSSSKESPDGGRPESRYTITPSGQKTFQNYLAVLQDIIRAGQSNS